MQKISFGYIYKTTNLVNNRIYIGQKKGEFNSDYLGSGILLKQAINKDGKNNFKLDVIVYAEDKNKLDELEKYYITKYREIFGKETLYNLADGGGGFAGNHTNDTKKKMSLSRIGHTVSEETRKKIGKANSIALRGKPINHKFDCGCAICRTKRGETKEQNKGENNGMFGKHFKHTKETIEKIKQTKAKYPYSHSKEAIEKIKMANLKRASNINYVHPMLGKHLSEEQCKMISIKTKEAMWKPEIRKKYLEAYSRRIFKKKVNSKTD
jgi:hypothetical protein